MLLFFNTKISKLHKTTQSAQCGLQTVAHNRTHSNQKNAGLNQISALYNTSFQVIRIQKITKRDLSATVSRPYTTIVYVEMRHYHTMLYYSMGLATYTNVCDGSRKSNYQ